ncbi:hypothetical protein FXN61_35230, partial [Lentzea sp. PSKA42]|nr:hypothetical protein [Lentzea indica]
MQIEPRRWPGRVVPSTDADVDIAVESLCVRASWPDADRRWVRRLLEPWFAAGWSVDALLVAVDDQARRHASGPTSFPRAGGPRVPARPPAHVDSGRSAPRPSTFSRHIAGRVVPR